MDSVADYHNPKKGQPVALQTYRTISLISHPSNVRLKVILNRLKPKAEEIIAEEQGGFRTGRSTTEQIFNLKILCEKYLQNSRICTMSTLISKKPLTEYGMQPYGPLFSNSAVKVHDSLAYRNLAMSRERISFTFDPRDMLLFSKWASAL